MPNDRIEYHFELIDQLAGNIVTAQSKVDDLHEDVRRSSSVLQAEWRGDAEESWSTVQRKWDAACESLKAALAQLGANVQRNSADMSDAEIHSTRIWRV